MQASIFKFVWAHSRPQQIILIAMTVAGFPFLYLSLELPKNIINEAIGGKQFPREFLGFDMEQVPYLLSLCGIFLTLVLFNGAFKYFNNVYRGVVGERMLRRLRYDLYHRVLRFPLPQFRRVSQGEIVSMIAAETEPLGGYIGDAIALPAFQGGTLLIILVFMFVQDPILGTAAIALYPLQTYLIPKLQRQVNLLKKERVREVRKLSERISETVGGVKDVHAHGTARLELALFSHQVGILFEIRNQIFRKKFFIKFLNNFIAQITPFFFYSIGGYLVIKGDLSFGALVAVLAAYKDLSAPWKELLNFYQIQEDARIKYDLLLDTFSPPGLAETLALDETELSGPLVGTLTASNLDLSDLDSGRVFAAGASFKLELPSRVAIVGETGAGKSMLAEMLAGLRRPAQGSLTIGAVDVLASSEVALGRRIAYVGRDPTVRTGTLQENIFYGLMQRPVRDAEIVDPALVKLRASRAAEAVRAGNLADDVDGVWVDAEIAGAPDDAALQGRAIEALGIADMEQDVYRLGLSGRIDGREAPQLAENILEARKLFFQRLKRPELAALVEPFDADAYNANMSVAENLIFGAPKSDGVNLDRLASDPDVVAVLDDFGLTGNFVSIGRQVAELMVDLFTDVEPGSELFEQFSFISADDLPEFRTLLSRSDGRPPEQIESSDRARLLELPFKLVSTRHRLGLIDESIQRRLIEARHVLARRLGDEIEPFDRDHFNSAVSLQDNILFGRLVYGRARGASQVGAEIREIVEELDMRRQIVELGLRFHVGVGGGRLSSIQRQKLSIARAVIKRPELLIVDEATAALDEQSQLRVMQGLMALHPATSLFWVLNKPALAREFDHCLLLDDGKIVGQGPFATLIEDSALFESLVEVS